MFASPAPRNDPNVRIDSGKQGLLEYYKIDLFYVTNGDHGQIAVVGDLPRPLAPRVQDGVVIPVAKWQSSRLPVSAISEECQFHSLKSSK